MENNTSTTAKTVLAFINAMNAEDFETARSYVTDDLKFEGVLGTRDGAGAYFKDMEKMKLKYEIHKVFFDEDDVCLFYNIIMSGKNIFTAGWYKVANNKIKSFKVVFDPRPLLEQSPKK